MRRTTPVLSTAAVVCGLLLIAPLPANAAETTANTLAELRTQVATANTNPATELDVITLSATGTYVLDGAAGNDAVASGDLDITGDLTINGNGATLDADAVDRFFDVASGTLTLNNVRIVDGNAPDAENGGAVRVAAGASLVVSGGAMNDNEATNAAAAAATAGSGGAIATAGTLTVDGTTFSGNLASRAGGAIEVLAPAAGIQPPLPAPTASITRSAFTDNATGNAAGDVLASAPGNGGGLHITGASSVTVADSSFTGNEALEGGGLWNSATGTLSISDTIVNGNSASCDVQPGCPGG